MKYMTLKQARIIQSATAGGFENELNAALREVAEKGARYELQFNNNAGLCAYIVYEQSVQVPETLADEYELRGEEYRCSECPLFKPSDDKRVKYTTCGHGVRRCEANHYACEYFYEQLEKGGIVPND